MDYVNEVNDSIQNIDHDLMDKKESYLIFRKIAFYRDYIMGHDEIHRIVEKRESRDDKRTTNGFHHDYFEQLLNTEDVLYIPDLDKAARRLKELHDHIALHNLRRVMQLAQRLNDGEIGDAFQSGYFGLLRAIDMFDPYRGFVFSTYATKQIFQAITKGQGKNKYHIPDHQRNVLSKISQAKGYLRNTMGQEPSRLEIAAHLEITEEEYDFAIMARRFANASSVEGSQSHEGNETNGQSAAMISSEDDIPPAELANLSEHHTAVSALFAQFASVIDDREYHVLAQLFGLASDENGDRIKPRKLVAIGQDIKLTRERVRQVKLEALEKIQMHLKENALREIVLSDEFIDWLSYGFEDEDHFLKFALLSYMQSDEYEERIEFIAKATKERAASINKVLKKALAIIGENLPDNEDNILIQTKGARFKNPKKRLALIEKIVQMYCDDVEMKHPNEMDISQYGLDALVIA